MMFILKNQRDMEDNMSNLTSPASGEADIASVCSDIQNYPFLHEQYFGEMPKDNSSIEDIQPPPAKKRRNLPGNPDPSAEVIALSPNSLLATNRFVCEICQKGFQRDQNLQLHRRGHNLPWKLKQRTSKDILKKVYICPEISCIHHDPLRALGDLTGIKKHFSRKHGEKKWKCDKCSKKYAVKSDWKAHCKTCGTREYRCDCGTLFTRRDSFITHRAFCDALAEASARTSSSLVPSNLPFPSSPRVPPLPIVSHHHHQQTVVNPLAPRQQLPPWLSVDLVNPTSIFSSPSNLHDLMNTQNKLKVPHQSHYSNTSHRCYETVTSAHISATALLQKAAEMGATVEDSRTSFAPNMFFSESKDLMLESSPRVIMGPNSLLFQNMPNSLSSSSPFVFGSSFEDCASNTFYGLLSSGKNEGLSFHEAGMTKDFLGLRPITSNEFLNFGDQVNGHDLNQYCAQNHDKNR